MPRYQLKAKFWDGQTLHPIDKVLELPEGTAPKGSILLDPPVEPEAPAEPEPEKPPVPKATVKKD